MMVTAPYVGLVAQPSCAPRDLGLSRQGQSLGCCKSLPLTWHRQIVPRKLELLFLEERALPCIGHVARKTGSLNQLSATTIGGGSATYIRRDAATRPSTMLCAVQFVAARRPRAGGVGPPDGKINGDNQLVLAVAAPLIGRHQSLRAPDVPVHSTRCPPAPAGRHIF